MQEKIECLNVPSQTCFWLQTWKFHYLPQGLPVLKELDHVPAHLENIWWALFGDMNTCHQVTLQKSLSELSQHCHFVLQQVQTVKEQL